MSELKKDKRILVMTEELRNLRKNYKLALQEIRAKEIEIGLTKTKRVTTHIIKPTKGKVSEATAFMVCSDWHVDEVVKPIMVNGLNKYNPKVATKRADAFFKNGLKLVEICQKDVEINRIVMPILGDMISSNIHDELLENNSMLPMEAIQFVKELLVSGIKFLLENSDHQLTFICHCGNHSRITKKIRHSTEVGNSLEYLLYHGIADHFRKEERTEFIISPSYHSYLKIYGKTIRFHHGHDIRYGGGVGGIYVPVNKAIAQWNKLKWADLEIFAHFHQMRDGGNFLCNGSLIGYNPYALSIKADFEQPRQIFFLWDKKRGKTITAPILLNE